MKVAIVADDLTGANATSALLSKKGFSAITCLENSYNDKLQQFEIVSFSTDSRSIPAQEAYQRVANCVQQVKHKKPLISKRIDSTLRGNLGAEVDAVIDNDPDLMAMVVPVYPSSGRICVGGSLLVNGVPLQSTIMKNDPKNPMTESSVLELFKQQSKHPFAYVSLRDVLAGTEALEEKLKDIYQRGIRCVIFDATTDEDIFVIADAANRSQLPIFCVDPGPFTTQYAYLHYSSNHRMANKVFIAIGSVSELTQRQIKKLKYDRKVWLKTVKPDELITISHDPAKAATLVKQLQEKMKDYDLIGIDTVETPDDVCDLAVLAEKWQMNKSDVSCTINKGIAEVTAQVFLSQDTSVNGLYTSGGDVTVAVTNRLNSQGFILKDEVEPLAVYGRLVGGECDGIAIVTKGGFVGNDNTLVHCIDYLCTKVSSNEKMIHD